MLPVEVESSTHQLSDDLQETIFHQGQQMEPLVTGSDIGTPFEMQKVVLKRGHAFQEQPGMR